MTDDELRTMIANDEHHWWYRGRRRVLAAELGRLELARNGRLLDAGCGSGRTLDELARRGPATGVDASPFAVHAARARGHADVVLGRIERLPLPDHSFDLVTCLDVIEHTPDDRASLRELRRVTTPGGTLVVTVPAYPALWSGHDERNRHFRRYTAASARAAALDAGWRVLRHTYFNSLLLGPAAAVRLLERRGRERSDLELTWPLLDRALELPLRLEAAALARGVRLPAGLSLLLVLSNPDCVRSPRAVARGRRARPRSHPLHGARSG
jgi:SAM-dependent methyltransferase